MGSITSSSLSVEPTINPQTHWVGPYGMLVPNSVNMVTATDGFNTRYKDGGETEMGMLNPPKMDKNIYLSKYAEFRGGQYHYKQEFTNEVKDFWDGPYGVKVPMHVKHVVSGDGRNTLYQDGSQTEMYVVYPKMTEKLYKEKYAVLGHDGYYYYK